MEKQYNLRPHHLLCIQKFTGHGYDEAFTKHMTEVVATLGEGADITLQEGCDDICVACPNKVYGACNADAKVRSMDEKVLATLGLHYEERSTWADFAARAKKEILDTSAFEEVCGECEWYQLCKETI